ncbi:MAG: uroporphyrinogen-III synthase, partial [Acidobacteriaceae bacterium]
MSAELPLAGKRVLVTRARRQAGQLSAELAKLGAEAVEIPAIEILPPESFAALDAALQNLSEFEWLIVTSANAVRA